MPSIDRAFAGEPASLDTAAPHPEEMKATIDLRIGDTIALRATARATPAGLVAVALLVAAIVVPSAWLVRSRRGRTSSEADPPGGSSRSARLRRAHATQMQG